jgi:hypothetical protein
MDSHAKTRRLDEPATTVESVTNNAVDDIPNVLTEMVDVSTKEDEFVSSTGDTATQVKPGKTEMQLPATGDRMDESKLIHS